jgi:hypothetical protein
MRVQMSTSLKEIAEIFTFVAQEADRINSTIQHQPDLLQEILRKGGIIQKRKEGGWNAGGYICGPEAISRLFKLGKEKVNSYPELRGRCKVESFFHPLEDQIVRRLIENREEINEVIVKEILASAKKSAVEKLVDWKYLFPIYLIQWDGGDFIKLGKVEFIKSDNFFQTEKENINKSIETGETFLKDAQDFYAKYPWLAIVEVKKMEPEIGYQQALSILEQTLNCLRLVIHSDKYHFIGIAEESPFSEISSSLAIDDTGNFLAGKSWKTVQRLVNDEFFKSIEGDRWFNLILHVVKKYQDCLQLTPSEQRLLEGLSWFGQGWKERDLSSKLIKYVTCLEGLLLLSSEREGITEKLAERTALLSEENFAERKQLFDDVKQIYDARSRLIHGKSGLPEEKLLNLCSKAERIAQLMLYACAEVFLIIGNIKDENKVLKELFDLSKLSKDQNDINKFLLKFRPIQAE